jgi:hypothetical protein
MAKVIATINWEKRAWFTPMYWALIALVVIHALSPDRAARWILRFGMKLHVTPG